MTRQGRTQLVLGILLVLAGIWFFADRSLPAFHDLVARYSEWPFNLVLIGAGLLVLGLILGAPGMAVPAAIVAGIGGLFYYFEKVGSYLDWFMWLLIPGFVGVGSIVVSAVLVLVFSSLFGKWALLGQYGPAILLILLGLWVLGNGIFRTWRRGPSDGGFHE